MSVAAAIDLGTQTILLTVVKSNHPIRESDILLDISEHVRLGEGLAQSGVFSQLAMDRATAALQNFKAKLSKFNINPEDVICLSTASGRNATNSLEFFSRIKDELGFNFQVIGGEEEAQLSYWGATQSQVGEWIVVDIGGGSTELRSATQHGLSVSMPMGAVQLTEKFWNIRFEESITDEAFWKIRDYIDQKIHAQLEDFSDEQRILFSHLNWVGVAGTVVGLGRLFLEQTAFNRAELEGLTLTRGDIHRWVEELKWRTLSERKNLAGMDEARAPVLIAGALILWRLMEAFQALKIQVSCRGLRFGALARQIQSGLASTS